MNMTVVFVIFAVIHIICCAVTLAGIALQFFDVHRYMFFVVLFLPFWGFLIVLILHFQVAFKADASRDIDVEKIRLDSEIFKSIAIEEKKNSASIIPIEEALLINTPRERRNIIMDVLNDNPGDYMEFLKKAGNNEDTEVVHYAVTALVEISKENDYILQRFEADYNANPDNEELLSEYCDFLWSCLEHKMMQGQVELMNRNTLNELLEKKLSINENVTDLLRLAENSLKLKKYTDCIDAILRAETLEKNNEDVFLVKIKYYAELERGKEINEMLEDAENNNKYFSAKAKEAIAFWKK